MLAHCATLESSSWLENFQRIIGGCKTVFWFWYRVVYGRKGVVHLLVILVHDHTNCVLCNPRHSLENYRMLYHTFSTLTAHNWTHAFLLVKSLGTLIINDTRLLNSQAVGRKIQIIYCVLYIRCKFGIDLSVRCCLEALSLLRQPMRRLVLLYTRFLFAACLIIYCFKQWNRIPSIYYILSE